MSNATNIGFDGVHAYVTSAHGHADHTTALVAQLRSAGAESVVFLQGAAGNATRQGLDNLADLLEKQNHMFLEMVDTVDSTTRQTAEHNEDSSHTIASAMHGAAEVNW